VKKNQNDNECSDCSQPDQKVSEIDDVPLTGMPSSKKLNGKKGNYNDEHEQNYGPENFIFFSISNHMSKVPVVLVIIIVRMDFWLCRR